ncbi:MAG TPA: hypothetical protein VIK32_08135, partial [Candidatus Limnocylindrales bacterium]
TLPWPEVRGKIKPLRLSRILPEGGTWDVGRGVSPGYCPENSYGGTEFRREAGRAYHRPVWARATEA